MFYCLKPELKAGFVVQQISGALHLAVDGWTSPTSESYLGIIVFWYEETKLWRAVLEFVRYVLHSF